MQSTSQAGNAARWGQRALPIRKPHSQGRVRYPYQTAGAVDQPGRATRRVGDNAPYPFENHTAKGRVRYPYRTAGQQPGRQRALPIQKNHTAKGRVRYPDQQVQSQATRRVGDNVPYLSRITYGQRSGSLHRSARTGLRRIYASFSSSSSGFRMRCSKKLRCQTILLSCLGNVSNRR